MNLNSTIECYSKKEVGFLDSPETGFVTALRNKVMMYIDQDTGEIQPPDSDIKHINPGKAKPNKKNKKHKVNAGGPGSGRKSDPSSWNPYLKDEVRRAMRPFGSRTRESFGLPPDDTPPDRTPKEAKEYAEWRQGLEEQGVVPRQAGSVTVKEEMEAGEEPVEMESGPIAHKLGKTIVQVGTQHCVLGTPPDTNLGCYPSREKAELVKNGRSFIEDDIQGADDSCDWITVKGQHICIKEGQSKAQAIKQHFAAFNKASNKVSNAVYTKQYKQHFYSKVPASISKSGKKEYHLLSKDGKHHLGVFFDKSKMKHAADKGFAKKQVPDVPKVHVPSHKLVEVATKAAKSLGVRNLTGDDFNKWQECAGEDSNYMAAGCGKMAALYQKVGLSFKNAKKLSDEMEEWTGDSYGSKIRDAAQEVVKGNPKSDLAKALAVENALIQASFGKGTMTLYRGIADDYAQKLVNTALKSRATTFKFNVNGADSWADSKEAASEFGNVILKTEVPTKYIMSSYRTNGILSDMDENEFVVAFPGKHVTLKRSDLNVDVSGDYAAESEKPKNDKAVEIDLTKDLNWLHNKRKGKKDTVKGSVPITIKKPYKVKMGTGHKLPNPSMHRGSGVKHRFPNPSMIRAGGPGSGRKGENRTEEQRRAIYQSVTTPKSVSQSLQDEQRMRDAEEMGIFPRSVIEAGGPGSGRHPSEVLKQRGWKYQGGTPFHNNVSYERGNKGERIDIKNKGSWTHYVNFNRVAKGSTGDKLDTYLSNIKAFADLGEPMAGALSHAHLDPVTFFRPPSAKRSKPVPSDGPKETDDKYLDVTKRNSKDTKNQRMKLLKRSAPGGDPPLIPAHTTLVAPHTASFLPGSFNASIDTKLIARPVRRGRRGVFVSYDRQGCI